MANATSRGTVGGTPFNTDTTKRGAVSTAQTFFPNCMVGLNTSGYLDKFDDAGSKAFDGIKSGVYDEVLSGGSNGDVLIDVSQPRFITVAFAATITVADIDKTVYATYDATATVATTTTYGNAIGRLHAIINSTTGVVECAYGGKRANNALGAARVMAATGNQTLTKYDLNKTIFVPNTATLTLTTPAVADTQAGDKLTIVKSHASDTNAITIDPPSSEAIDGSTTLATMDAPYDTVVMVSTGAAWIVLARDIA